jgi:hypothetical protein
MAFRFFEHGRVFAFLGGFACRLSQEESTNFLDVRSADSTRTLLSVRIPRSSTPFRAA